MARLKDIALLAFIISISLAMVVGPLWIAAVTEEPAWLLITVGFIIICLAGG